MNNTKLWQPLTAANIGDPYPMYKVLRTTDPVHRSQTGEYIVTNYQHVKQVLKSNKFKSGNRLIWLKKGIEYFDNKQEDLRPIYRAMNAFILMLDDGQHQRIRNFVSQAWNDRDIDTIIENNISKLLGQCEAKEIDFVNDYAQPLPVYTIADILGIAVNDHQYLAALGIAMTKALDLYVTLKDLVQMNRAATDFIAFFRELLRNKTDKPDNGLFSKLIIKNRRENIGLSDEELISIGIFLFTAGEETSAGLISNAMLNLLQHPEELALLRRDPNLTACAIEEVLRYDSPVQLLGRLANEDVMLGDTAVPAGATVTLVIASANRDESVFEKADKFIITRKPNRHLSFGSGAHFCLGDWLARKQSQRAIQHFLANYSQIQLSDQHLTRYNNLAVRRLSQLHLALER